MILPTLLRGTVPLVDLRDEQPDRHEIGRRVYLVADVEPLDVDGVRTVAVGTGLWFLGFLGLLPFWSPLQDSGRLWWVWASMAGAGLGLLGVEYCRRRRTARTQRAQDAPPPSRPSPGGRRRA